MVMTEGASSPKVVLDYVLVMPVTYVNSGVTRVTPMIGCERILVVDRR
jgi:hypothetical protein